jgi:NTE family protein
MSGVSMQGRSGRPILGLALSGGGARGLAHIGVLAALEQAGVAVDRLAGTSMGAILGAAYSAGRTPAELRAVSAQLGKFGRLIGLADLGIPRSGLIKGTTVERFLRELFSPHRSFETLAIPLVVAAVDLRRAEEVGLDSGDLLRAVQASMAVPGIFPPVEWDGRLLVDGGILNNLPVDLARAQGAQVVLAVDVGLDPRNEETWQSTRLPRLGMHVWRAASVMMARITASKLAQAPPDLMIRPALPPRVTSVAGFRRAEELIQAGERAAQEVLPRLRQLLQTDAGQG